MENLTMQRVEENYGDSQGTPWEDEQSKLFGSPWVGKGQLPLGIGFLTWAFVLGVKWSE